MENINKTDGLTIGSSFQLVAFTSTNMFNEYVKKVNNNSYFEDCYISIEVLIPISKQLDNRGLYDLKLHYELPNNEEKFTTYDELIISSKVFLTDELVNILLKNGITFDGSVIKVNKFLEIAND